VPPFSVNVRFPDFNAWQAMRRPDIGKAIKELSRLTYGRDRTLVEATIAERARL
jgi:hypothetical protein